MIRLALPRLSASIMISCSISHLFSGAGMALQDERVAAADRLVEPDEDLAVGEVAGGLRGDRDVELLGDLLGQFGVRATRERASDSCGCRSSRCPLCALAGRGIDTGQSYVALRPVCCRVTGLPTDGVCSLVFGCRLGGVFAGFAGAPPRAAAAEPGRFSSTQPSMLRCGPADTASAPGGTSSRTTVPAPV